jgi:hypothetical protein
MKLSSGGFSLALIEFCPRSLMDASGFCKFHFGTVTAGGRLALIFAGKCAGQGSVISFSSAAFGLPCRALVLSLNRIKN